MRSWLAWSLIVAGLCLWGAAGAWVWYDMATLFGHTGEQYDLCWKQIDTSPPVEWVEFKRVRVEGGAPQFTPRYLRADWKAGSEPEEFCLQEQKLPRSGHYLYEMRACFRAPFDGAGNKVDLCSDWVSSADPQFATVKECASCPSRPRGWWIVGVPAPPSEGTIN